MVDRLSTSENFVLFVIQRSNHDLVANDVMRLTSLSLAETEQALHKLSSLRLIEVIEDGGVTYYAPRRITASPLLPDFEGWLRNFCSFCPQWDEEDPEATTFDSCGVVILAALLSGSKEAGTLALITSLPEAFVMLVIGILERLDLWWSERLFDLEQTLLQHAMDYADVNSALHGVKEEFWNACWTPRIGEALEEFRAGHHYRSPLDAGSETQNGTARPLILM
jgi:hypothetical protein